jgi:hypothetical protein
VKTEEIMEYFLAAPVPGPVDVGIAPMGMWLAAILLLAAGPPLFLMLRSLLSRRTRPAQRLRVLETPYEPKRRAA